MGTRPLTGTAWLPMACPARALKISARTQNMQTSASNHKRAQFTQSFIYKTARNSSHFTRNSSVRNSQLQRRRAIRAPANTGIVPLQPHQRMTIAPHPEKPCMTEIDLQFSSLDARITDGSPGGASSVAKGVARRGVKSATYTWLSCILNHA